MSKKAETLFRFTDKDSMTACSLLEFQTQHISVGGWVLRLNFTSASLKIIHIDLEMDKKTVLTFFALCGNNKTYCRIPDEVNEGWVPSWKIALKFSICVGSQLCFVQGLLLNS